MTLIGAITIDVPVLYSRSGYNTSMEIGRASCRERV